MMDNRRTALDIPLWLVGLVALGFVLIGVGSFGILDNNEGLYAEIPREMLASHDWRAWIIPHLNGLPYMEKPPLLYWLTAASFAVFGESEWSARVVPALSSLACVGMLVWFGGSVGRPKAGRLAALMFVSGVGVTAMSHVLMFDMLLTALLMAALMYAYRYVCEERLRFLRLAYAFLALALLAKGLVAMVLFGLVVIVFLLVTSRSVPDFFHGCLKWFEPWSIAIFFAIVLPWHLTASVVEPIFAWFYFINEHVLRFLGRREPHDYYAGAWWYYLPRMAIYLFPWSFLLPSLLSHRRRAAERDEHQLSKFLLVAWGVPLLFFSVSSAKANYYLVAVMPFAALHLAVAIENRGFLTGLARAVPGLLIGILAGALCVGFVLRDTSTADQLIVWGLAQRQFIFVIVGVLTVLAFASAVAAWRLPRLGILSYLAMPLWIAVALSATLNVLEPTVSTRQTARYLQTALPGRSVYLYRNFEEQSSLPFYLKRLVPVIDAHSNDLFWGNKLRVNDILISSEHFSAIAQGKPIAVVVLDRQLVDFRATAFARYLKGEKRIGRSTVFYN